MTISLTPTNSDFENGPRPIEALISYRGDFRYRIHEAILGEFARQETAGLLSRSELATRIHKKKEQITRWLGAPNNFESDTISDLLFGMGKRLSIQVVDLDSEVVSTATATKVVADSVTIPNNFLPERMGVPPDCASAQIARPVGSNVNKGKMAPWARRRMMGRIRRRKTGGLIGDEGVAKSVTWDDASPLRVANA